MTLSIILFVILEAIASIGYYQKNRNAGYSIFSTVEAINWGLSRIFLKGEMTKYDRLSEIKSEGKIAYPSYTFNSALHHPNDPFYLSNVPNSHIVFCRESSGLIEWGTDELGFRNPKGQLGKPVDVTIIGDSFAEGACESEENTFAGVFRKNGKKVFNLGRGDSGPLFQLATLVEYGALVDSDFVLWVIFTGNDLRNLQKEKVSKLSNYLDKGFSQDFANNTAWVKQGLQSFLELEFKLEKSRRENDNRKRLFKNTYQEMDALEFIYKESKLLEQAAQRILATTRANGSRLAIVLLNHPRYSNASNQDMMAEFMKDFSLENDIPFIEFTRIFLSEESRLYTSSGPHFSSYGYRRIGSIIDKWMNDEMFAN